MTNQRNSLATLLLALEFVAFPSPMHSAHEASNWNFTIPTSLFRKFANSTYSHTNTCAKQILPCCDLGTDHRSCFATDLKLIQKEARSTKGCKFWALIAGKTTS
jgi:hypothetical protein